MKLIKDKAVSNPIGNVFNKQQQNMKLADCGSNNILFILVSA